MYNILGWTGPSLIHLNHTAHPEETNFSISSEGASWIGSLMPMGALFGGKVDKILERYFRSFQYVLYKKFKTPLRNITYICTKYYVFAL